MFSKPTVSIESNVPTLDEILPKKSCTRGLPLRRGEKLETGKFSLGSLVFDCDDYGAIWNILAGDLNDATVTSLVKLNNETQERPRDKCLHSLYSLIFCSFLDKNFAAVTSHAKLHFFFNAKITCTESVFVDMPFVDCFIDSWIDVFSSLQKIAKEILRIDETVDMIVYMLIVEECVKHSLWIQYLIEEVVSLRCGPLIHLVTRVTQENINFIMGKLKLTSSVNFLQQLFCSPSVMGKCTALYQLLEIHGVLWRSINVGKIEAMIPTLYNILDWIFEKCKDFSNWVISGFKWVKARFRRADGEENKYPTLKTNLPETPEAAAAQCADIPSVDTRVIITTKKEFTNQILFGNIQFQANDSILYDNNCFFESISSVLLMDPKVMRKTYYDMLLAHPDKCLAGLKAFGFDDDSAKLEFTNIVTNIEEGRLLGVEVVPFAEELFDVKIVCQTRIDDVDISYSTPYENRRVVFLRNDPMSAHWTLAQFVKPDKTVNAIGEAQDNVEEPEVVSKPVEKIVEASAEKEESTVQTEVEPEVAKCFVEDLKQTEEGRSFLDWIKDMAKDTYYFFRKNAIVGGAIAFAFSIASALGITISKFKTLGDKRSFWDNISAVSKDFYYLSRGQDAFCKVFGNFGEIIRNLIGIDDTPDVTAFKEALLEAAEEADRMNAICTHNPTQITNDPQKLHELKIKLDNIRVRYLELIRFNSTVNLQSLQPIWQRLTNSYTQLNNFHMQYCFQQQRRVRPACVWFWGSSNVGKSELCQRFVNDLNRKQGTAWEVFTVSKGPDYLNNYRQQKIILIDDFDSFTSQEGCLDALLVMNMVTSAPYNPNMAALDEKNLQANPSLILIASNFQTAKLNCGVNDFLAFERRRNHVIKVTWPDHERCDTTDDDCEHWTKVRELQEQTGKMNFDHLQLFKNHSLVYSNKELFKEYAPKKFSKEPNNIKPNKVITIGSITLEALVDDVILKMRQYEKNHDFQMKELESIKLAAMKRSVKPQANDEPQLEKVQYWHREPNIMLTGPPGIGKSYVMNKVVATCNAMTGKKKVVKYVLTAEEFDQGESSNWSYNGVDIVLFDDYITFKRSKFIEKFWQLWKSRADRGVEKVATWVLGVNEDVMIDSFATLEEYEAHTRTGRVYNFRFTFQKKDGWFFFVPDYYSSKDVSNLPEGKTYGDIVEVKRHDGVRTSHDGVVSELVGWEPKRVVDDCTLVLPIVNSVEVDALVEIDKDSSEFIGMINGSSSISECLSLILKAKFSSEKFSKGDVGKRVLSTFRSLAAFHGTNYPTLDSFIITGANNRFFDKFNDGNFVISFKDVKYAIVPVGTKVAACKYVPTNFISDLKKISACVKQTISTFDFLSVARASLPPWFVLATSCLEQIIKFTATGLFTSHVIKQNQIMFDAITAHDRVMESSENYYSTSNVKIADKFESITSTALGVKKPSSAVIEDESDARNKDLKVTKSRLPKLRLRVRTRHARLAKGQANIENEIEVADSVRMMVEEDVENGIISTEALPQIASDESVFDSIGACMKNMVSICTASGDHLVYGLMIRGKQGTTVAHITLKHKIESLVVKDHTGKIYPMRETYKDTLNDRVDFVIEGDKMFRDITSHISPPTKTYFEQKLGVLVNFNARLDPPVLTQRFYRITGITTVDLIDTYQVQSWAYTGGLSGYTTELPPQTKNGDCGSIMFLCDASRSAKIIGMHIAANNTEGFFRCIDTSQVTAVQQDALSSGPLQEFVRPMYPRDLKGNPVIAKCVEQVFLPDRTRLYKSPFAYGECIYEPSVLSKEDPRAVDIDDMVYKESMKWLKPQVQISPLKEQQIRARFTVLGDYIGQKLSAYGIRTFVLTKVGALNSVKGFTHSQPIPVSTSPGYPFNKIVRNGKRNLIYVNDKTGERRFTNDVDLKSSLHSSIDHVLERAREGKTADVAYVVFPKDELLKKEKLKHKTRTIAAAPLHLVIALRMYFHTNYAAIAEIWASLPIKVGISANSSDWHSLAIRLFAVSDTGFSIDQTDFDFNIPQVVSRAAIEAHVALVEHTNPNLTPEIVQIMRGLHKNITDFKIVVNGLVYEVKGGVPSGHPGTAPENSLISLFLMYDAFCHLAPSHFAVTIETFFALAACAIYGDDVIVAVHKSIEEWFNLITVASYLNSTYDLKITTADKSKIDYTVKPLTELTFISRGFKRLENQWCGPLEMHRLVKPFHFCSGTRPHHYWREPDRITDDIALACAAARSALDEMFLHGAKEYERARRHCLTVIQRTGITDVYFPPYCERHREYFDVPEADTNGLTVCILPLYHSYVKELTQMKGWINYANRRCLLLGKPYSWDERSKIEPLPLNEDMENILMQVNRKLDTSFNQILVNEYKKDGEIPWHKDNEPGLDIEEGVASVTLIGDGVMLWRDKKGAPRGRLQCYPGLCYYMTDKFVEEYQHSRSGHTKYTITLTFRKIITSE